MTQTRAHSSRLLVRYMSSILALVAALQLKTLFQYQVPSSVIISDVAKVANKRQLVCQFCA